VILDPALEMTFALELIILWPLGRAELRLLLLLLRVLLRRIGGKLFAHLRDGRGSGKQQGERCAEAEAS
jgi:hypothetical protein